MRNNIVVNNTFCGNIGYGAFKSIANFYPYLFFIGCNKYENAIVVF